MMRAIDVRKQRALVDKRLVAGAADRIKRPVADGGQINGTRWCERLSTSVIGGQGRHQRQECGHDPRLVFRLERPV